jgi:16S rRNA G527 N7-methylase RsmG
MFHVKQFIDDDPRLIECVTTLFTKYGIELGSDAPRRLSALLSWLAPSARRLGLTKYGDSGELFAQLVAPSLAVCGPQLRRMLLSPALDFGAGACAVGLSLALVLPELEVVLADRRERVVQFGDLAIHRFQLTNCRTLRVDLNSAASFHSGTPATALIRAYGPPETALSQAMPWVRRGGTLALWHQPGAFQPPDGLTVECMEHTTLPTLVLTVYRRA